MKKMIITGISGTLGSALGREYKKRGWYVIGVSRKKHNIEKSCDELIVSSQTSLEDAKQLVALDADCIILNAGQIETDIDENGLPLVEMVESMNRVNYTWPAIVMLEAVKKESGRVLDIVAIGSIADGSPSCFGPVYHAGKIALHYYWTGVGPIAYVGTQGKVRVRLYRPGAIKGPLAWAPVNRLNEKGYKIRKKRVDGAPEKEHVAEVIANWIDKGQGWVGTYEEPFGFKIFKYLFVLFPNLFYKLQILGWKKGSKFV